MKIASTWRSLPYDIDALADVQQAAYPNVKPLITQQDKSAAFDRSRLVTKQLGWDIIGSDKENGIVEATVTSKLWGFKDDIVIRLRERAKLAQPSICDPSHE